MGEYPPRQVMERRLSFSNWAGFNMIFICLPVEIVQLL